MSRFRISRRPRPESTPSSAPRVVVELDSLSPQELLVLVYLRVGKNGDVLVSDPTTYTYHGQGVTLVRIEHEKAQDRWIFNIHTSSGETRRIRKRIRFSPEIARRLYTKWDAVTAEPKSIFAC
jgi:hypothetical protein